ncbi:AzlC family ABC transporter permease [Bifidobacterium thermophilum]|uniref:AzlC family ABC transporter permease n=1 Tax=Bifidobacterium thermophilum TaxID=33905 RepID=UPI00296E3FA9
MSEHPTVDAARDAQPESANTADGLAHSAIAGSADDERKAVDSTGVGHGGIMDCAVADRDVVSGHPDGYSADPVAVQVTDHIVEHDIDGDSASASRFVSHASTRSRRDRILTALRWAWPNTLPVLTGYLFLGITYGVLMTTHGFPFWLPIVTALVIYTGSMEFLLVGILSSSFNPLSAFLTAVVVGARHLFYGIAMLGKYRNMGWKKPYLIFTTSDETFSVNYSARIPRDRHVDRGWFYFWVSFLDQMYWVVGSAAGAVFGSLITVDISGLDFVMTAMFMVIFLQRWFQDGTSLRHVLTDHVCELIGVVGSLAALLVFGPERFIIPAMAIILVLLLAIRRPLERGMKPKEQQ